MSELAFSEFLARLRALPVTWRLDSHGAIRCTINGKVCCPITALAGGKEPMYAHRRAAIELGLPRQRDIEIAYASDNLAFNPAVRAMLLAATVDKGKQCLTKPQ